MNAASGQARILRAAQLGRFLEADAALAAARAEAVEIRAAARRNGFAEGRAEGLAAGTRLVAETAAELRRQLTGLEAALAGAIAEGVTAVLGSVPCPERVALAAGAAINDLRDRARLVVRVAPAAAEAVRTRLAGAAETLVVLEDAAMRPDGCIVEGAGGRIEAGIDGQVAALQAALGLQPSQAAQGLPVHPS